MIEMRATLTAPPSPSETAPSVDAPELPRLADDPYPSQVPELERLLLDEFEGSPMLKASVIATQTTQPDLLATHFVEALGSPGEPVAFASATQEEGLGLGLLAISVAGHAGSDLVGPYLEVWVIGLSDELRTCRWTESEGWPVLTAVQERSPTASIGIALIPTAESLLIVEALEVERLERAIRGTVSRLRSQGLAPPTWAE